MEGDEYRAEENSEGARKRGEAEAQAHARPDKADRDRKEMKISQKPEWALIDYPAVPLVLGNVVDRFAFDSHGIPVNVVNPCHAKRPMALWQVICCCRRRLTLPESPTDQSLP